MASPASAHVRLEELGSQIRHLKETLTKEGLPRDQINQHKAVVEKVAELQRLKGQLSSDDPCRDEVFFARQKQERAEAQQKKQAEAALQRVALKGAEEQAPQPLIQRKIFHLFQHTGNGGTFCYEPPPRLNTKDCGFGKGATPLPSVYITEKWDGTTMQATSRHIFKRLDMWGKRRDGQDPSLRYSLRLLAWRGEETGGAWRGLDFTDADVRLLQALTPHLQQLAALEDGLCVYFEAVHTDINANFKHLPGFADIRVFDFSRSGPEVPGRFLPFHETIQLAERYGLPLVGWERREQLSAEDVWQSLVSAAANDRHYTTAAALIEGFVVREAGDGERIAKARLEHLQPKAAGELPEAAGSHAKAKRPAVQTAMPKEGLTASYAELLSRCHLQAIGLLPGAVQEARPLLLTPAGR